MAQLIFVAALEFPEFTFFKTNEDIAFPPLNKQLVILLQLLSNSPATQCLVCPRAVQILDECVSLWQGDSEI